MIEGKDTDKVSFGIGHGLLRLLTTKPPHMKYWLLAPNTTRGGYIYGFFNFSSDHTSFVFKKPGFRGVLFK